MKKIIGTVCICVGLCGLVYSYTAFPSKTFKRLDTIQANKVIYENVVVPGLNHPDLYIIDLPNEGWVKSGSWVKDLSFVLVKSPANDQRQPFELKIGNKEIKATLHDGNFFYALAIVSNKATDDVLNIVRIDIPQEQVLLKVSDEVASDSLKLKVIVGTGSSLEQLKTLKIEKLEEKLCLPF
jgi:hypothetical protein